MQLTLQLCQFSVLFPEAPIFLMLIESQWLSPELQVTFPGPGLSRVSPKEVPPNSPAGMLLPVTVQEVPYYNNFNFF